MWKVGDMARYIGPDIPSLIGTDVDIICVGGDSLSPYDDYGIMGPSPSCHPTGAWGCRSCELIPIPDDKHKRFHEALIAGKWSDCEFNPMVTVEVRHEAD